VELDQVLGLSAGAVEAFIQPGRAALGEAGDDEADVQAEPGGLDAGDHAPVLVPGFGAMRGLGMGAQRRGILHRAPCAHGIGGASTLTRSGLEPGKPKM
jgi:hypothetical protein